MTSNEERRERLISFLQEACSPRLLPSPLELAVSYIEKGCPSVEPYHEMSSALHIAQTWKEVSQDHSRTFVYDIDGLSRQGKSMREHFRALGRIVGRAATKSKTVSDELGLLTTLDSLIGCQNKSSRAECRYGRRRDIWRLSAMIILFMMCSEADMDPSPARDFWSRHKLGDVESRTRFLFGSHPQLVTRGPFAEMAIVAYHQLCGGKSTRGLLWDCLQAPYLVYSDMFLTNDGHFTDLNAVMPHRNFDKVRLVCDLLRSPRRPAEQGRGT